MNCSRNSSSAKAHRSRSCLHRKDGRLGNQPFMKSLAILRDPAKPAVDCLAENSRDKFIQPTGMYKNAIRDSNWFSFAHVAEIDDPQ